MASPMTALRGSMKDLVASVYATEGWTAADDRFGRSKGMDQAHDEAFIAISPDIDGERARPGRILELYVTCVIQFHLGFDAAPDENIVRDPGVVEAYADRLRAAFDESGDSDYWFAHLEQVRYPPDPTGNITRFEAIVQARAANLPAWS